jgi:hypothetical protein
MERALKDVDESAMQQLFFVELCWTWYETQSKKQVEKVFKKRSLRFHPDKQPPASAKSFTKAFQALNRARDQFFNHPVCAEKV